uniref:NADH-ubiquinone oxidoreductase chain 4 n=1 Tax=Carrhotus xanthogramma TaxID=1112393 RepID=A0A0H3W0W3_CARXA|nr:NADH dehydrogenase subunit 4 [Carrhotus xanthogramma]AKH36473.1 NADH dehydrogenase subunit 4 [Carrhotus xanthogramma]
MLNMSFTLMFPLYMIIKLNSTSTFIIIMTLLTLLFLMKFNNKFPIMSQFLLLDHTSLIMLMLTTTSILLIILSTSHLLLISKTIIPILIILIMTFMSDNIIMFYILFEMVLIPTMFLITLNGKQPERLQASIYLIIYTVTASLPLLISIIWMKYNSSFLFNITLSSKFSMIIFMMMAFLVKMPMYLTHLWLPKAHVEAPLEGSMILAAVLLKLGGYGIIRFLPLCISSINKINFWIISISMIGATATSMNCIRQKDLKSLIAYSSVAHMGFVLTSLFTFNSIGFKGVMIMMIAHGLSSSALFPLVNELYMKYHTRNIILFKGLMTTMPNVTFWWFMFMALNISAPPTINTMSEIMMMSSIISWSMSSSSLIFLMSLMTASFSLLMFVNIIHNKNELYVSLQTHTKIFTSLLIHFIPSILLIMKLDLVTL